MSREAALVTKLVLLIRIGFLDGTDHAQRVLAQLNPEYRDLLLALLTAKDTETAAGSVR